MKSLEAHKLSMNFFGIDTPDRHRVNKIIDIVEQDARDRAIDAFIATWNYVEAGGVPQDKLDEFILNYDK